MKKKRRRERESRGWGGSHTPLDRLLRDTSPPRGEQKPERKGSGHSRRRGPQDKDPLMERDWAQHAVPVRSLADVWRTVWKAQEGYGSRDWLEG